jgi:competence protein ComEA
LTPAERRAALLLVLLLALGAVSDLLGGRGPARGMHRTTAAESSLSAAGPVASTPPPPAAVVEAPLDLNRATARQLDDLPGVGPVLAERILEHRRRFGPFRAIEDLRAVRGIGPRAFERLRARVCVGPVAPAARPGDGESVRSPGHGR